MPDAVSRQRLKSAVWRRAFPRWPQRRAAADGYSLLLPVPADLPVFLNLALSNTQFQDRDGRVETLVVPDMPSAAFREAFGRAEARFDVGELRLVELGRRARSIRRFADTPGANHFLQIYAGVCAARATHALLHDADLFIDDPTFMRRHHRLAVEAAAGCLGVSPAWDDWLREHGLGHVVATWELMVDTGWMRSFEPWRHRPHVELFDAEWHLFDLTLYPQAISPPGQCRIHETGDSFEHFSYAISAYRLLQHAREPFEDRRFNLLLIRLLSDAYSTPADGLPTVAGLAAGIADPGATVTYVDPETPGRYAAFRSKLRRIVEGPLLDPSAGHAIERAVEPFDRAFVA